MKPIKLKVEKTKPRELTQIGTSQNGSYIKVSAVRYYCDKMGGELHMCDADGDEFMLVLRSQSTPNTYVLDHPIAVKMPLRYYDTVDNNQITIWGEIIKPSSE